MNLLDKSRKEIGALGERIVIKYIGRHGMRVIERNFARKTGELDIVAQEGNTLHFIEVKTVLTDEFPSRSDSCSNIYDPSLNLHESKIKKISRTGEWYMVEKGWKGEWQVDGCLVWLRRRDGAARISYLTQIT